MRTILSIDGGGMRGIIPAVILSRLEDELPLPLSDCFDVIAGVSTGGILACGLAAPRLQTQAKLRASDMLKFYTEDGPAVFRDRLFSLFRPKYDADVLRECVKARLPAVTLSNTDTELLVTAYALNHGSAVQFCTSFAKKDQNFDFRLSDLAWGTALAPTYFGSRSISSVDGMRSLECIDGGVARNNVATLAIAHAKQLWPNEPVFILSLGTGVSSRPPAGSGLARNWGALKWAPRVIPTFMDATSDFVSTEMRVLADESYRINPSIDNGMSELDNASPQNISALIAKGEETWAEHSMALKGFVATALLKSAQRREVRRRAGLD